MGILYKVVEYVNLGGNEKSFYYINDFNFL